MSSSESPDPPRAPRRRVRGRIPLLHNQRDHPDRGHDAVPPEWTARAQLSDDDESM